MGKKWLVNWEITSDNKPTHYLLIEIRVIHIILGTNETAL